MCVCALLLACDHEASTLNPRQTQTEAATRKGAPSGKSTAGVHQSYKIILNPSACLYLQLQLPVITGDLIRVISEG